MARPTSVTTKRKAAEATARMRGSTRSCTVEAPGPSQRALITYRGMLRAKASVVLFVHSRTRVSGSGKSAFSIPTYSLPRGSVLRKRSASSPPKVTPNQPPAAAAPPTSRPTRPVGMPWMRTKKGAIQKPMP